MTDTAPWGIDASQGLIGKLGLEILEVSAARAVATMPVAGNTQPYGLLHGGATAALAETVGSLAAMAHAGEGRMAVGVDLNITHHKGVTDGVVTAVATAAHLGRTTASYDIVVNDMSGARVASARLTCFVRNAQHT